MARNVRISMTKVMCDACSRMIEVEEFDTAAIERDIQKVFFRCPHCGKECLIRYDNARARYAGTDG